MSDLIRSLPYNVILSEVESTNDYARKMGEEGAPHGSWISAQKQTSGRGRLGREWKSNEGNLFLSVVLRFAGDYPLNWVPLTTSLAVYEAAKAAQPEAELVLKWPNDLGLRDRKLGFRKIGGILCEGVGGPGGSYVIAGIGVNCAIAPETDQPTAALGVAVDPFREALLEKVETVFRRSIFEVKVAYERASLLRSGDSIEWRDVRELGEGTVHVGTFEGYGENGELLARTAEDFTPKRLYSEEVKLRVGKKSN